MNEGLGGTYNEEERTMARTPSPATELRNLKSRLKLEEAAYSSLSKERDVYRTRATKAEQEAAEWKRRFDLLLEKSQRIDA